jgi:hypothetical protein
VVTAPGTVWVTVRTTAGALDWYAAAPATPAPAPDVRVSLDEGASWGAVDAVLAGTGVPVAQLFHAVAQPAAPLVELYLDGGPAGALAFAAGAAPLEFTGATGQLPAAVTAALAATSAAGGDRAGTVLTLFCRAAVDLTVDELTLSYDPSVGG